MGSASGEQLVNALGSGSSPAGVILGAMLLVVGLAFLGVIAASLAVHFGLTDSDAGEESKERRDDLLLSEVRALRAEVARMSGDLARSEQNSAREADERS